MHPFFSIIIVNYNHGKFIEEAIASVINQSCSDYELIIVDGASTDNSLDIINKYKDNFSWWVSEKDKGQSDAFNKGFAKAVGKFLFWLNADDILLPDTLFKAKNYLEKNEDCIWLAGNTLIINEERVIQWCIRGPIFIDLLIKKGTVYIYGPSSFFTKDLFSKAGKFDVSLFYTMDTDLWYRFVNLGAKFSRLDHYCWGFRMHEDSKTSHSLHGVQNPKYMLEKKYIESKNNHHVYKIIEMLQLLVKIFSGTLLRRWIDNKRFAGKKI